MRDLVLTGIFVVLIPAILYRPYIGAIAWAWVSLMSPQHMAYSYAASLPFAMIVAVTTLVGLITSRQLKQLPVNPLTVTLMLFVLWMSITTLTALNPDVDDVNYAWRQMIKMHLMLLVTTALIRGRRNIEYLIWIIFLSIGYYGVKGGIFTITSGGSDRVWGPEGTFIAGNNELALAVVTLIPFIYYLARITTNQLIKRGLWLSLIACIFSVMGSHSRGALLAILAMSIFFIAKSDRRFALSLVLISVLLAAAFSMPTEWYSRMSTITDFEGEGSAMSRIFTWTTIWNMVIDRPIVGAGFRVGSNILYSLYAPGPWTRAFDAHSIYFQALGEHGFPGFILYMIMGVLTWRKASELAKTYSSGEDREWVPLLMRMIQVSIIGFASGGAFLGLLHYDFPYYLLGLVVIVEATLKNKEIKPNEK